LQRRCFGALTWVATSAIWGRLAPSVSRRRFVVTAALP
jgi:hypothetical protein